MTATKAAARIREALEKTEALSKGQSPMFAHAHAYQAVAQLCTPAALRALLEERDELVKSAARVKASLEEFMAQPDELFQRGMADFALVHRAIAALTTPRPEATAQAERVTMPAKAAAIDPYTQAR